jgi:hypothetical protein
MTPQHFKLVILEWFEQALLTDRLSCITIEMSRRRSLLMPTDNLSAVGSIDLLCRDR